jgi:hypothetical protein
MNARVNFFVVLSLTLLAGLLIPSWAQSQVGLDRYLVKTGDNTMRVAVVNRTTEDLSGLKLRFAQGQPQWFRGQAEETLNLGIGKFVMLELPFEVSTSGVLNEPTKLELVREGNVLGSVSVMLGLQNPRGGMSGSMKTSEGSQIEEVLSATPEGQVMEALFIPTDYGLSQNYPNPFNPTTTIQYDLPQAGWVVLKIYDVLGRNIRTLVEGGNPAGRHTVRWDGKNDVGYDVPSGLYFCRMTAGSAFLNPAGGQNAKERESFVQIKKMLLVR